MPPRGPPAPSYKLWKHKGPSHAAATAPRSVVAFVLRRRPAAPPRLVPTHMRALPTDLQSPPQGYRKKFKGRIVGRVLVNGVQFFKIR